MSAAEFREGLCKLLGSDLPECVDREDYLDDFPEYWRHDPPRAFLRLTDDDQREVWALLVETRWIRS